MCTKPASKSISWTLRALSLSPSLCVSGVLGTPTRVGILCSALLSPFALTLTPLAGSGNAHYPALSLAPSSKMPRTGLHVNRRTKDSQSGSGSGSGNGSGCGGGGYSRIARIFRLHLKFFMQIPRTIIADADDDCLLHNCNHKFACSQNLNCGRRRLLEISLSKVFPPSPLGCF